ANQLNNKLIQSPNNFFLSSVWMSGFGIAADGAGQLYFTTGNSDFSGTTYNSVTNLSESVIKMNPDLTQVSGFFTPSDPTCVVSVLDPRDGDFSAGVVLVVPSIKGGARGLVVAAGKVGRMYLLNRNNLGGYSSNGVNRVLGTYDIGGPCWCGPSWYRGRDGVGRGVGSGGAKEWR